jgi:hypothetical protein
MAVICICRHFPFQGSPKFTQMRVLGLKIYHLATLHWVNSAVSLFLPVTAIHKYKKLVSDLIQRMDPEMKKFYTESKLCNGHKAGNRHHLISFRIPWTKNAQKKFPGTRVTRLAIFRPTGDCLLWAVFWKWPK